MRIFQNFDGLDEIANPVITIGTFDGVHLGHQKIINRLNGVADSIGGESVLLTFYPHPRMVLYPDSHGLKLIQTQAEKIDKLRRMGLQNIVIVPFTRQFSRLTALDFVRKILVHKMNVRRLVIGYDHQFGKNREGSIAFLKSISDTYGFQVDEIAAEEIDEVNVSSTKIRRAISDGDVETANRFLGEPFELNGRVIRGSRLGRELGFPTANIDIESEIKLLPANGVYAVEVILNNEMTHHGMMNIGTRPTIGDNDKLSIEINLFDFDDEIYDQYLTVRLLSRVRPEHRFSSLEELKAQIIQDEKSIRNYFASVG